MMIMYMYYSDYYWIQLSIGWELDMQCKWNRSDPPIGQFATVVRDLD